MTERERYMLCSDCGFAVKEKKMFKKIYQNTAICLCRKCALKLAKEIANTVEVQMLHEMSKGGEEE